MADYRLYILHENGRIRRPIEMRADDDEEAIALARDQLEGEPAELWNLHRKVRSFRGDDRGPSPTSGRSGSDAPPL